VGDRIVENPPGDKAFGGRQLNPSAFTASGRPPAKVLAEEPERAGRVGTRGPRQPEEATDGPQSDQADGGERVRADEIGLAEPVALVLERMHELAVGGEAVVALDLFPPLVRAAGAWPTADSPGSG